MSKVEDLIEKQMDICRSTNLWLVNLLFLYDFLAEVEKPLWMHKRTVVVITRNIPAKTLLTPEMLDVKKVPLGSAHAQELYGR